MSRTITNFICQYLSKQLRNTNVLHNKMDNFVTFLESYQNKPNLDYFDFERLLNTTNAHYNINNYHHCFKNDYVRKRPYPLQIHYQNIKPVTSVIKRQETIDFAIDSLNDLISLLDKYPYDADVEYNIDLKNLHKIRPELIELDKMIGLSKLKISILNQLIYFIQEPILCDKSKGFKHTILSGPPGTGKTEIARIIGTMYSKIGVLSEKNIFKKVTRSDLIAGYLGQTSIKTREVIQSCLGGCLFIDEAYSLGNSQNNDIFAKECIDTLCEALSDNKDDLMVIIAGYENELNEYFFSMNQGLESRFIWKFNIDKYTAKELLQIFYKKVEMIQWSMDTTIDLKDLTNWFEKNADVFKHYGRDIEQWISHIKVIHSRRIYGKSKDLCKIITMSDMEGGLKEFKENSKNNNLKLNESMYGLYL